jgi:hypothetical protein
MSTPTVANSSTRRFIRGITEAKTPVRAVLRPYSVGLMTRLNHEPGEQKIVNRRERNSRKRNALGTIVATSALFLAIPATSWAWAAKAYYPSALEPTLPDAHEARQLMTEPPWFFQALRAAHRESLSRSWKSITPPVAEPSGSD